MLKHSGHTQALKMTMTIQPLGSLQYEMLTYELEGHYSHEEPW